VLVGQPSTKKSPSKISHQKQGLIKSTYNDDEAKLKRITATVNIKSDSIIKLIREKYNIISELKEPAAKHTAQQEIDDLYKKLEQFNLARMALEFDFIRKNPSSFVSLDILHNRLIRGEASYDTVNMLYYQLNKNLQVSNSGKNLKQALLNSKRSEVGNPAPPFTVRDVNANPTSLTHFRNKYVLLDFWASWCKPCRDDIPTLHDIYARYKNNGFEIIGISQDEKVSLWKQAIAQDKSGNWTHILVPPRRTEKIDTSILDNYFVFGIPVKVLINKEGIIIARWSGGGDANLEELDKILKKIFNK
jgi:thiol-disulfide isomerase/thioredoxin